MRYHRTFRLAIYTALVGLIVALLFLEATDANAGAFRASIDGCVSVEDASVTCQEPSSDDPTPDLDPCAAQTVGDRERGCGVVRFQGHGAEYWHWQLVLAERKNVALQAAVDAANSGNRYGTVEYALRLAAAAFPNVPLSELRAVARCESGFDPHNRNLSSTASGLFQFLDSTWRGAWGAASFHRLGFSVYDPVANALAAAQVVARDGGWRQWACAPR